MTQVEVSDVPNHESMIEYGRTFARRLRSGDVVLLHGDLGAGKTTLTQGVAVGLGVSESILSPTFSLVAEHEGVDAEGHPLRLYHLDLYRLADSVDLEGLGYEQYIDPVDGVSVIEWPERAAEWMPERFWLVQITHGSTGGRVIRRSWHDMRGEPRS